MQAIEFIQKSHLPTDDPNYSEKKYVFTPGDLYTTVMPEQTVYVWTHMKRKVYIIDPTTGAELLEDESMIESLLGVIPDLPHGGTLNRVKATESRQ